VFEGYIAQIKAPSSFLATKTNPSPILQGQTGYVKWDSFRKTLKQVLLVNDDRVVIGQQDDRGLTALTHACDKGHSAIVELLLAQPGADEWRDKQKCAGVCFAQC